MADSTRWIDSLIVESGKPTRKHLVPWVTLVSIVIREAVTPKTALPKVFVSTFEWFGLTKKREKVIVAVQLTELLNYLPSTWIFPSLTSLMNSFFSVKFIPLIFFANLSFMALKKTTLRKSFIGLFFISQKFYW